MLHTIPISWKPCTYLIRKAFVNKISTPFEFYLTYQSLFCNRSFDIQVWKFQKLLLEHDGVKYLYM